MDYSKLVSRRNKSQPLYVQLQASLVDAIESGELPAGTRLPSERDLAARVKVSRTTVVNAYQELESRGIVRSHVGRGTFVCAMPEPTDAPFAWRGKVSARLAHTGNTMSLRHLMHASSDPNLISFAVGAPAFECFPVNEFRRAIEQSLKHHADIALGLGPTEGQPRLRRAVARRFGTRPERILILSGSQQGVDLIARCLIDPGDAVIIDRPGYVGATQTLRAAGANLVGWDTVRADLGELEDLIVRYRPKLVYTDPTFQNPTGRVLPLRDRQDLLKLAARYRVPVVEDDPWWETYLDAPPPQSLYHLDTYNIVIHLSTFSKVLAPGLRLGWLAASEYIIDQLASIKQHENLFTEGLGQFVLADFLQSGLFDDHLIALRQMHTKKRNLMRHALERHLPPRALEVNTPRGGLHFWCRLNNGIEAQPLLQEALLNGMAFAPGEMFYADGAGRHELRLCFSSVFSDKIEEGVKRLGRALRAAVGSKNVRGENARVPFI
jgi:DNA-binding transcriptional MocR family regulator